jgi:GT2 family glycosyltransferase
MQPRVTAILVARNGVDYLDRTLAALASQTRRPDAIVVVDAGSSDSTAERLAASGATQIVTSSTRSTFGSAVAHAAHVAVPSQSDDDWIWLLAHDSAPHPAALAALLGAVEIAPSVAIAGPKLVRWDDSHTIAEYGETMTRLGASVRLVENELDQSQYDTQSDLLAVAASGMLVRQSVWTAMGGFDPGLPTVDAALDFCVRVRLAGYRVVGVPDARISSAGGPELFGRKSISASNALRARRSAQLHRRMVYGAVPLVPLLWLSLVPLAIVRSIGQLIRKQPGSIGAELASAFATAFSGSIGPARRNLRKKRALGWRSIAPLRMSPRDARERRLSRPSVAEESIASDVPVRSRASFISGGGLGVVILMAVIGVLAFSPLLGASFVSGGALLPLSSSISELWSNVGYAWHDVGGGSLGASDPFVFVLALLGSLTFWAPSLSIVVLYLVALPLAALGAWWCATRLSERAWPPAIAAILWALAPSFLSSMTTGHLGGVIAHILLPWFAFAILAASRNWAASAAAALLFAGVVASAPSLAPALVVMIIALAIARPTGAHRVITVIVPAAVLFLPLVIAQVVRGTPLALFADPGLPTARGAASAFQLALGSPDSSLVGWDAIGELFGVPHLIGPFALAILLIPFAVLALLAVFLPGGRRTIPSLVVAFLGFVTAFAATHLQVAHTGSSAVTVWAGPGLSLYWLGLTGAIVVTLDAFRSRVVVPGVLVSVFAALAVAPLLAAPLLGQSPVGPSSGSLVPAYVVAQATHHPRVGTLVLTPQKNGSLAARVDRGDGATLDEQSTLAATSPSLSSEQKSTAILAANLASRSGLDTAAAMGKQHIGFVLLQPAPKDTPAVHQRAADALDANLSLAPVGSTSLGLLYRYTQLPAKGLAAPVPTGDDLRDAIVGAIGVVFVITALLAIPTARRRRRSSVSTGQDEHATLGEDDDA